MISRSIRVIFEYALEVSMKNAVRILTVSVLLLFAAAFSASAESGFLDF